MPGQTFAHTPPYVTSTDSEFAKAFKDVSIVAVIVVVCIVLIVTFTVYLVVRFLRGVVDAAGRVAPTAECAAWIEARRRDPRVGRPRPLDPTADGTHADRGW